MVKDGGMPIGGFPAVLGHEGLGVVKLVGAGVADKSLVPGDTVILSFHSCRKCTWCQEGRYGGCPHMTETNFINTARQSKTSPISLPDRTSVHGQFFGQSSLSKLAVVTERSVVKIDARPEELPYLAPLACGYLTGASTVLNVLTPKKTESIAVLGMGAVGLAAVMAAKALGVEHILAVDIVDSKLSTAIEVGASHAINPREFANLHDGIRSVFANGADKIVDATGVIAALNDAVKALAHGGTLALVGVPPPNKLLQLDALDLLLSCKKIVGVIEGLCSPQEVCYALTRCLQLKKHQLTDCYNVQTIPKLVKLFHEGKFPVDKLATLYPTDKMAEAIEDFKNGKVSSHVVNRIYEMGYLLTKRYQVIKPILCWGPVGQL